MLFDKSINKDNMLSLQKVTDNIHLTIFIYFLKIIKHFFTFFYELQRYISQKLKNFLKLPCKNLDQCFPNSIS